MSSVAPSTSYDLRFQLLNVPVRVHPLFWLVTAVLGWNDGDLGKVALWIGCVFVSILVHEFGHALMGRRFGGSPSIVLYSLGGLCYSGSERTPGQRLAVILGGPAAGLLLFLLTLIVASLALGMTPGEHLAFMKMVVGLTPDPGSVMGGVQKLQNSTNAELYFNLLQINLYWTLVNLLPIWPLDGGQASQIVMSQVDRRHGVRRSHILSLLTAGVLALLLGVRTGNLFLAVFMGYFAFLNFQVLQSMHDSQAFGSRDDDWWRQ
ncbi:site-2 protease family protein [Planctomyces sp. SH-PL62]|uniref:site-2 protease family protein n=1 Tax=Planctomyces sp. SH-PL62 TaxID=1636152 RepID=UPI00078E7C25|nr:site-2 protease family protein [Planctomyces sp. SH-PL62]AMV37049.1 Peptidase family M50 [Planctomyces sp. SH-PL62]